MRQAGHPGSLRGVLASVCCTALLLFGAAAAHAQKNQAPSATLTSPSSGASFVAPATVSLAATASDPNGTVARVDFFQGNTLIGSSSTAPYTATWSNVAAGSYTLTAKAIDNQGATGTSAPVSITVASATSLVITSPLDGAAVSIASGLSVSGTYEGPTTGNTILVDDPSRSVLATISGNSYSASLFGGLDIGANILTVRLMRADRTSATRSITVFGYATPVVAFTAPSSATFDAPANVTFAVDAKAPGGAVTQVAFLRNGQPAGTVTAPPYEVTLTGLAVGTHTITANATSSRGPVGSASTTIQVLGPNTLPTISITSPASGTTYTAPATVTIAVSAADPDGTVSTVEYSANGALIHVTNVAPFSFTWSNVAAGSYSLTARATDNRNGQTTSAPVSITVNNPPTVTLTAPVQGASFVAGSSITLTADASDTDGTISRVEFYQGSTLIGTATTAPYSVNWSTTTPGTYALTAKAFDNLGGMITSAATTITVSGPQVSLTSPANGANFSAPATVTLTAEATQIGSGAITQVEFYQGTTLIGTVTSAPYSVNWTGVAAGSYTLTAKATDSQGVSATSSGVTITLSGPQVSLTSPANGATFSAPATIALTAEATQIGAGTIAKVEFFQGATLIGTVTAAPYNFSWTNVAIGTYTLTAKATDSAGASATSSGVSVTVNPSLAITSPANGATVGDDRVLVIGQLLGPQYAGLSVNGVIAFIDQNGNFYANDVPLPAASNTVTATLTALDGTTTTHSITVSSTGPAPIRIDAKPLEGGAPLNVAFDVATTGGASFTRADYDFTGDGSVDFTLDPPNRTVTLTYSAPGIYIPVVTATDSLGRVVQRRFAVLADANPDAKLRATFNAMLDRLRAGDVDGALRFIAGGASAQYASLFNALKQAGQLTSAVNALGTLRGSTVGPDFGEVILTRDTPSGTMAFPIWFLRGHDGVWRIEGM
jgi:hypothetical protein